MARKTASPVPTPPTVGPAPEVVRVHAHRVACDGVGGALGHPRVYLDLGVDGTVDCPYCDRRFVVDGGHGDDAPGVYEVSGGH
ncbi:MAG: zinc-finger domain-containing protein [Phenylobacterium sp.]